MKKIIKLNAILFLFILPLHFYAQGGNYGISASCHVEANGRLWAGSYSQQKSSSVKVEMQKFNGLFNSCSGTLVNQVNELGQIRQLLILSRHCFTEVASFGSVDIDFSSNLHRIVFNYQSPNSDNTSTPLNNRGSQANPSSLVTSARRLGVINNGYRFSISTSLTRLAENRWGDYAILEINEPIPPHFLPFYSGYQTTKGPIAIPSVGFHHPRGDIKKLVKFPTLGTIDIQNTICHWVTSVVDFLFGWIWSRRSSTRRVCRIISIPWYIGIADDGGTENGSSGSGLFGLFGRHVGALSGSVGTCTGQNANYARNSDHYFDTDMRNYLNPQRHIWADNSGWPGTYMDCYPSLNLNGYYWPHSDHNQNGVNYVPINSNGEVNLARNENNQNEVQWIVNGSDYSITAGSGFFTRANPLNGGLNQNDNFFAARGSNLSLKISPQPCSRGQNSYKADNNDAYIWQEMQRTQGKTLPPFGFNKLAERAKAHINIYPNPAAAKVKAQWSSSLKVSELRVVSVSGKVLQTKAINGENRVELDLSSYSNGLYFVQFFNQSQLINAEKIQVQH